MKPLITMSLCAFSLLVLSNCAMGQESAHSWQHSTSATVQLGLRDKYGSRDYKARFEVISPAGMKYQMEKHVPAQESAYGYFPTDFKDYETEDGQYSWSAYVGNERVQRGKFTLKSIATPTDQATVFRA